MKRTALALSIAAALLISMLVAVPCVRLAAANFGPYIPPIISIQCPENGTTYTTENLALTFTCSNAISDWLIGSPVFTYSLDGNENVTIKGSTTLLELSYGTHDVTVYALFTTGGHVAPDPNSPHTTVTVSSHAVFSVEPSQSATSSPSPSPTPSSSPSPTASPPPSSSPSVAPEHSLSIDPNFSSYTGLALLITVVACLGLLVYLKKRKR